MIVILVVGVTGIVLSARVAVVLFAASAIIVPITVLVGIAGRHAD
jgi:hypothetical protein